LSSIGHETPPQAAAALAAALVSGAGGAELEAVLDGGAVTALTEGLSDRKDAAFLRQNVRTALGGLALASTPSVEELLTSMKPRHDGPTPEELRAQAEREARERRGKTEPL